MVHTIQTPDNWYKGDGRHYLLYSYCVDSGTRANHYRDPNEFQETEQSVRNESVDEQQSLGVFRTVIGYPGALLPSLRDDVSVQ